MLFYPELAWHPKASLVTACQHLEMLDSFLAYYFQSTLMINPSPVT
jgi:hypothetical protein